jgi:hypothetical protein
MACLPFFLCVAVSQKKVHNGNWIGADKQSQYCGAVERMMWHLLCLDMFKIAKELQNYQLSCWQPGKDHPQENN